MSDIKIKCTVHTDKARSKTSDVMEVDDYVWSVMPENEKAKTVLDFLLDNGLIEYDYSEVP